MKRIRLISISAMIIAVFTLACTSSESGDGGTTPTPDNPVVLPSSSSSVSFTSDAKEQSVSFTANSSWSISISESKASADWVQVSPMSGSAGSVTLTVVVDENSSFESRSATIVITAGGQDYEISVSQNASSRSLVIDPSTQEVSSEQGDLLVTVTSNCDWSVTEVPEWVILSESEGSGDAEVVLSYDANEGETSRVAEFAFEAEGLSRTFILTQLSNGGEQEEEDEQGEQEDEQGEQEDEGEVEDEQGEQEDEQGEEEDEQGEQEDEGEVEDEQGEQEDEQGEQEDEQEDITPSISIDKLPQSVGAESGSFVVNVTANTSWATSGVSSWITLTPSSGTGDASVTVSYSANDSYDSRKATISFYVDGQSRDLEITQSGMEFVAAVSIDKSSVSVSAEATEFALQVTSNTTWTTSGVPSWVVLTPSQGTGDTSVTVSVRENSEYEGRTATILFSVDGKDCSLSITQAKNSSVVVDPDIDGWGSDEEDDDGGIGTK